MYAFNRLISAQLKAHIAGLGAALVLLVADLNTGDHVTLAQWAAIAAAYLGVGAVTYTVPNTPSSPADSNEAQDPEAVEA